MTRPESKAGRLGEPLRVIVVDPTQRRSAEPPEITGGEERPGAATDRSDPPPGPDSTPPDDPDGDSS